MNLLSASLLLGSLLPSHGLLPNKPINAPTLGVANYSPRNQHTRLFENLWERMEIEADDEPMWYLINCVAGLELDLLKQCKVVTEDMDDVVKLVVPMQRSTRSHGANRMVTDVKVKYQGYVFGKLRLTEQTYLAIQGLDLCRSWMGTVNQRGYRKLPPAPLPLNEDEIENFGLEDIEEMEEEEELSEGGDTIIVDNDDEEDKEAAEIEEIVKNVYKGLQVGDMVKVTAKNKFFDEDGIVRRLKDEKIFLRFYTYGTMFEEWLDPSDVRKLGDEEILKGLSGAAKPITQQDIDGPNRRDRDNYGETRGEMRRNLYDTMGGGGQRNRRQDRNERRFNRGDSLQEQQRDRKNWDWYKDNERKQRGGAYADGDHDIRGGNRNNYNYNNAESDADAQWGRGPRQQRQRQPRNQNRDNNNRNRNNNQGGDDWSSFVSNSPPTKRQETDDFFDSLYNDLSNELDNGNNSDGGRGRGQSNSNGGNGDDDFFGWLMDEIDDESSASKASSGKSKKASAKNSEEDDFFASLEMELQDDKPAPRNKMNDNKKKPAPPPSNDVVGDFFAGLGIDDSQPQGPASVGSGAADDFFASLEADLETELATTKPVFSNNDDAAASQEIVAGDDFFANLEADLETELATTKPAFSNDGDSAASAAAAPQEVFANDDFFASLEADLETELATAKPAVSNNDAAAAAVAPQEVESSDDFFASWEADLKTDQVGGPAPPLSTTVDNSDDYFDSLESGLEFDDFVSELEEVDEDIPAEPEVAASVPPPAPAPKGKAKVKATAPAPSSAGTNLDPASLQKCTIPVLKDMLRERGLKVSGKKADLIERLAA